MKVVVFGASGRVGSKVVALLQKNGHDVLAVVHSNDPFLATSNLQVVQLDVHDQVKVAEVISQSQAVLSALSNWGSKEGDVLTVAMQAIVPAMKSAGVRRIISLTGNAAFTTEDKPTTWQKANRAMLAKIAPKVLADGEKHMKILLDSDLDWTVIRSPVMNEIGHQRYRLSEKLSGTTATIHRQAVAQAMVDQLDNTTWFQKTPVIWRA
ncbi:NAD(P)H-binding protein [Candidatus Saccharibacteria bacterium]|nr:MAG: NAD(P)H-binding protein [Candidatus Saccharibacteria bacterium]